MRWIKNLNFFVNTRDQLKYLENLQKFNTIFGRHFNYPEHVLTWEEYGNRVRVCVCVTFNS